MRIHLIGIGGIGVSALAQYYLSKGHNVSGSDLVASEITDFLRGKGLKIFIGKHKAKNIQKDLDLVVYSPAVKKDNPEFAAAKKYKIKTISYPEALGELTKEHYTIAVAGAHGKSTTTTMISLVLAKAGLDPTVIVGTRVKEFGNSNFRKGESKILVIEACEYDSSFLHYLPKVVITTNVDKEHLDFFKTFANVKKAFTKFIEKLPKEGWLVANSDDEGVSSILNPSQAPNFRILNYSLNMPEAAKIKRILKIPGQHNVSNALAALQVARILEIPDQIAFKALAEFTGTWRRFEIKKNRNFVIISDYAHHPNEIMATLQAAREKYRKKAIWCVFQPHQHQRTHYLFSEFIKTFRLAPVDKIIITDIYDVAGRETKTISRGVSSKKLVEATKRENVIYLPMRDIEEFVKKSIKSGDVLVIMGAGNVYKLADGF